MILRTLSWLRFLGARVVMAQVYHVGKGEGAHEEPVSKVSASLSAVKRCDAKRNHVQ